MFLRFLVFCVATLSVPTNPVLTPPTQRDGMKWGSRFLLCARFRGKFMWTDGWNKMKMGFQVILQRKTPQWPFPD